MKRRGIHRPTVEDVIEISGIETLHPGGMALTRRTGEAAGLKPGMRVLDVSSGRGTQSIFYARTFGVQVVGVDLSPKMIAAAEAKAKGIGVSDQVRFELADSQSLPMENNSFDAVINECAVGIPDDSQAVLNEMVRVTKPGGSVLIHESTWLKPLSPEEKDDFSEVYGTTPLEKKEWIAMLQEAGISEVSYELEEWSKPEMFWKIRQDRDVAGPNQVMSLSERLRTFFRVRSRYGFKGVRQAYKNADVFYRAVLARKLGYGLYWGEKPSSENRSLLPSDETPLT